MYIYTIGYIYQINIYRLLPHSSTLYTRLYHIKVHVGYITPEHFQQKCTLHRYLRHMCLQLFVQLSRNRSATENYPLCTANTDFYDMKTNVLHVANRRDIVIYIKNELPNF